MLVEISVEDSPLFGRNHGMWKLTLRCSTAPITWGSHGMPCFLENANIGFTEGVLYGLPQGDGIGRLLVTKKERTLLLNSQVILDYPEASDVLLNRPKIKHSELGELPHTQQVFFRNTFGRVLEQASAEWVAVEQGRPMTDLGDDRIPCRLCGTMNRYVYWIRNKRNGKEINVGSECIKHFGIDVGSEGKSEYQLRREARRLTRRNKISKKFEAVPRIVDTWRRKLREYPVVIPLYLEREYEGVGKRIEQLYRDYVNEKADDAKIDQDMPPLLELWQANVDRIDDHVSEQSSNPFAATRAIANWLERRDAQRCIIWLKEDGEVKWRTACRIAEPAFLEAITASLDELLSTIGARIVRADPSKQGYAIALVNLRGPLLFVRHADLLTHFGAPIFNEKTLLPLTTQNIVEKGEVSKDRESLIRASMTLQRMLRGAKLRLHEFDVAFDEAYLYDAQSKDYIRVSLRCLVDELKEFLFLRPTPDLTSVRESIRTIPQRRMAEKEMKELREIRDATQ